MTKKKKKLKKLTDNSADNPIKFEPHAPSGNPSFFRAGLNGFPEISNPSSHNKSISSSTKQKKKSKQKKQLVIDEDTIDEDPLRDSRSYTRGFSK